MKLSLFWFGFLLPPTCLSTLIFSPSIILPTYQSIDQSIIPFRRSPFLYFVTLPKSFLLFRWQVRVSKDFFEFGLCTTILSSFLPFSLSSFNPLQSVSFWYLPSPPSSLCFFQKRCISLILAHKWLTQSFHSFPNFNLYTFSLCTVLSHFIDLHIDPILEMSYQFFSSPLAFLLILLHVEHYINSVEQ